MQVHDGHRQRMYEKMKNNGLLEHEWLEVLLYGMQPRRNTNEVAHRLIQRFGTVEDMLAAPIEELQTVKGVGPQIAAHLKCIQHFYAHYKKDTTGDFVESYTVEGFLSFVKQQYRSIPYEVADLYILDGEGFVIKKRGFSIKSISAVLMDPEILSMICLTEGARGVVLVHNHPCGVAKPSKDDERMTKNMQALCSMHNLLFCDHIICATNGLYSYYLSKRLTNISKDYSMDTLISQE